MPKDKWAIGEIVFFLIIGAVVIGTLVMGVVDFRRERSAPPVRETAPLYRQIDREAGVVCYSWSNRAFASIDCMPISWTTLDVGGGQ